jgi:hypothetical protein
METLKIVGILRPLALHYAAALRTLWDVRRFAARVERTPPLLGKSTRGICVFYQELDSLGRREAILPDGAPCLKLS